jgi:hypothetical protein
MIASLLDELKGQPGKLYVFSKSASAWDQVARVQVPADDPAAPPPPMMLGMSVRLQSAELVAGAPAAPGSGSSAGTMTGAAYVLGLAHANGDPCTSNTQCASGFCVDEICCNTECGGAEVLACQVCSVAAGATADGVCTSLDDGTRCDDGVFCNGADSCFSGACAAHAGYPCRSRNDGDGDCRESCDEIRDDCTAPDDDNVACEDGRCRQGLCARNPGGSCTSSEQCRHGNCLDGLCCLAADCGAYRCGPGGSCLQTCLSRNDCASGYQCASNGECVPAHRSEGASHACNQSGRVAGGPWGLLVAAALALCGRRRATGRSSSRRRGGLPA